MDFEEAMSRRFGVNKDDVQRLWRQKRAEVKPVARPRPGQGGFGDVADRVITTLQRDTGRI